MKSHFRTSHFQKKTGVSLAALAGVALMASVFSFRAKADDWDKTTFLTLSEPAQVMNTYLEPGTYMFKLANSDRHIVQIFNRDRSHLINTIIAVPAYRTKITDKAVFTFWETPPGTVKAVRAWYYPDDHYGQEFTYPTQLRQIAAVTGPSAPSAPPQEPSVIAPAPVAPAPEPEANLAPQAEDTAPESQEPVEIAQNNAPPAPSPDAGAQAPAQSQSQDQSQNSSSSSRSDLPQTASQYPLIGLAGVLFCAAYFGLRRRQFR